MIEVHVFQNVVVTIAAHTTVILFADGKVNMMDRLFLPLDYADIAAWAGYGDDVRGYNLQHDLTHCWFAEVMGRRWCPVLHDPFLGPLAQAPQEHRDIEHMVNRLQRQMMTGEPDEFGVLQRLFGGTLPSMLRQLAKVVE
jgi:hypothetical protein